MSSVLYLRTKHNYTLNFKYWYIEDLNGATAPMNGHNISPKAIKFKKGTTQKSNILTRECGAQQPLAGQNIQHLKYEAGLLPQKLFSNSQRDNNFFKYCYTAKEIIILIRS